LDAYRCQCIKCPCRGAGTGAATRNALEQGGNSLEGAFDPRSRQGPARGGVQPPSEAESRSGVVRPSSDTEPHSRWRPTHERGGFVPGRRRTPRAKQSSAGGWLGRLFVGPWARGFVLCTCLGLFVFVFYEFKRVSPGCLGDPHGYPRHDILKKVLEWCSRLNVLHFWLDSCIVNKGGKFELVLGCWMHLEGFQVISSLF
jgi:hypothetical protein